VAESNDGDDVHGPVDAPIAEAGESMVFLVD
jgi:hypothetical protein